MANLVLLEKTKNDFAENLLSHFCNLNQDISWDIIDGEDNVAVESAADRVYTGERSMKVTFNGTGEATWTAGGTDMLYKATKDEVVILSGRIFVDTEDQAATINLAFQMQKNGNVNSATTFEYVINQNNAERGFVWGKWVTVYQSFSLNLNDELDFQFKAKSNVVDSHLWIDGLKLERADRGPSIPSPYTKPKDIRFETIQDFGVVADGDTESKTVTVAGARQQNEVTVIAPIGVTTIGGILTGDVTDQDEVTVTWHNDTGSSQNLPNAKYIILIKE